MVRVGKARTVSRRPPACTHYQLLPAATIKPNRPKNLDSTGVNNYTYMKPIDYIGLYILVTILCVTSTNWLYRLYF